MANVDNLLKHLQDYHKESSKKRPNEGPPINIDEDDTIDVSTNVSTEDRFQVAANNQWGRPTVAPDTDQSQLISCPECGLLSYNTMALNKHMEEHHSNSTGPTRRSKRPRK